MKKSKYVFDFETEDEYVLFSWLEESFVAFPRDKKEIVKDLMENPDSAASNEDAEVLKRLQQAKIMLDDGFDDFAYLLYNRKRQVYNNANWTFSIIPTFGCNFECFYCFETREKGIMSQKVVANLKKFIEERIKNLERLEIDWFGGEPLLCPVIIEDLSTSCRRLCEENGVTYAFKVTTNGYLLNDENISILNKSGVHTAQVTLDGSEDTHNRIRFIKNHQPTFQTIIDNIKRYLEFNARNRLLLRINIHKYDDGEHEAVYSVLKGFNPELRKRITQSLHYEMFDSCSEEREKPGKEKGEQQLAAEIELYRKWQGKIYDLGFKVYKGGMKNYLVYCKSELNNFWAVRPDGYLTKCTVALEKDRALGKLTDNGIEYNWDRYLNFSEKNISNYLYDNCKECIIFPYFCSGGCILNKYLTGEFKCSVGGARKNFIMEIFKLLSYYRYKERKKDEENIFLGRV